MATTSHSTVRAVSSGIDLVELDGRHPPDQHAEHQRARGRGAAPATRPASGSLPSPRRRPSVIVRRPIPRSGRPRVRCGTGRSAGRPACETRPNPHTTREGPMFRTLALALAAPLLLVDRLRHRGRRRRLSRSSTGAAAVAALRAAPDAAAEAGTAAFEMVMSMTAARPRTRGARRHRRLRRRRAADVDGDGPRRHVRGGLAEATGESVPAGARRADALRRRRHHRLPPGADARRAHGHAPAGCRSTPDDLGESAGSLGLGAGASTRRTMLEVAAGRGRRRGAAAGQEDVRGVATTQYTATVEPGRRAAEPCRPTSASELEAQLDQLGSGDADVARRGVGRRRRAAPAAGADASTTWRPRAVSGDGRWR